MNRICYIVVALILFTAPLLAAEPAGTLSLLGTATEGKFKLAVEYYPEAAAPELAGLLVWAEPSHTLLLAHWNNQHPAASVRQRAKDAGPLVETEGLLGESHPRVVLPYTPAGDEEIRVEAVRPNGETILLLAGRVNVSQFNVTTELEVDR